MELGNINFGCLMYANDLVLLYTSETGLQSCLDKLSFFCVSHGLTVNLKKANILIFILAKVGENLKHFFYLMMLSRRKFKHLNI